MVQTQLYILEINKLKKLDLTSSLGVVANHIKSITESWGLMEKSQGTIYLYPASPDLLPLVMMACSKDINLAVTDQLVNADILFMRQNDPDRASWESTIKEYDLYVEFVSEDILFPWQEDPAFVPFNQKMLEEVTYDLLTYLPDDEKREGLLETPKRVAKAWAKWTEGYAQDPASVLKVFEDGAEGTDEMVVVRNIPIYSKCEHHLADIFGTVDIAYMPNGKVVGLSKLSRVANIFARRLQVQERLTNQIADAIMTHLEPLGVGVVIRARHMCMESRGLCQQGHFTVTSALRGAFKEDSRTRQEFLTLTNSDKGV